MNGIEYVLTKNDLATLAEQAGSTLHHINGEMRGNCPLHHGDGKNNFVIYEDAGKQKWKCFSNDCGQGDVIDFVMKLRGIDLKSAIQYLGGDTKADPNIILQAASERAERAERQLKKAIEDAQQTLKDLREARAWERYHERLTELESAQIIWELRGVPRVWQNIWKLGYCDNFNVTTDQGKFVIPSLTMPIFGNGWELLNLRHRLLNPFNPKDKYRPDKPGLKSQPFMTDPDLGMKAENFLIVEGEIKSMVTYVTLDSPKWQILGIPGKSWFRHIADSIKGRRVVICFDPDAEVEANQAAKETNGKVIALQVKIDDAINDGTIDQSGLINLIKGATKPHG